MNTSAQGFRPAPGLVTGEFVLRPIRAGDADSDHDAVMETRDFLRLWEGTGWPEEGFTVEENREDLVRLQQRHEAGESYTYTVVSPTTGQCMGCVYLFPTSAQLFAKATISAKHDAKWADFKVAVYFWIRQSRLAEGLDEKLLDAVAAWLHREWRIDDYLFITNEFAESQLLLLERAGQTPLFEVSYPNKQSKEWVYGRLRKSGGGTSEA